MLSNCTQQQLCRHRSVPPVSCPSAACMNLPGKPHIVHKADAVYHRGANNAACLSPWPAVRRRHTAAAAASAVGAKGPQPAQEAGEPDEEEEEYEEFDEHEDEWEDEVEYEEGEYEEIEEGAEHAVQQQASSPVAAAVTTAAAVPRNIKQIPLGQQTVEFTADDFVEVGIISRAHGVKGEVKVQLITDEPKKRLGTTGRRLWLQASSARGVSSSSSSSSSSQLLQRVTVQWGRLVRPESKDRREEWAVKFREVPDRDKAESLAGHKLLLALCDRETAPRSKDEFFITDLVGLRATAADTQQLLGIVTEVYDSTGSYSLLRVRLAPNEDDVQQSKYRSILVPFVEDMVPVVDVDAGQLLLSLPEGLLETASAKKLRRPYTPEQQAQLRRQLLQRQATLQQQQ